MTEAPDATVATPGFTDDTLGADPSTFAEGHLERVKRLERQLANNRKWSRKATRQLHSKMLKEVQESEGRARKSEKRAKGAERRLARVQERLETAEAELSAVHASPTWKAGRAVVAVPARLKRLRGR